MEITAEHHRALSALAQRRHLRGFSVLVQEALDAYLVDLDTDELDLEGVLSDDDVAEMWARIEDPRALWRVS